MSAKHQFQLLRVLTIAGQELVFNVDILHPQQNKESADLFIEHLPLEIEISQRYAHQIAFKSITTPLSQFIFDGFIDTVSLSCEGPTGAQLDVSVPVISEVALIVTKAKSVDSPKRTRDALDIFLAVNQARDFTAFRDSARSLRERAPDVYCAIASLAERALAPESRFAEALAQSARDWNLVAQVRNGMTEFQGRMQQLIA